MKILAFLALFCAAAVPAAVQSASGSSALQYYVGTWSCMGGTVGRPQSHATLTYTLQNGILNSTVAVPRQNGMKTPYFSSSSTTYDAKNNRYIQGGVSNDPSSYTGMWTLSGNVETTRDTWVSNGKPGHGQTIRTSQNMFSFTGYPTMTSMKPNFKATCHRST